MRFSTSSLIAVTVLLVSCGESPTQVQSIDRLTIVTPQHLIATGDSLSLAVVALDAEGDTLDVANSEIHWSTSNTSILSVSSNGVIRGVAAGTAMVTAAGGGSISTMVFRVLDPVSSFISYRSDPGDYVGQGQTRTHHLPAGSWKDYAEPAPAGGAWMVWLQAGGSNWSWTLNLAAPAGQALTEKTYVGATRFPFQEPSDPGMDFSGNGRGCNTLEGDFTIENLVLENDSTIGLLHATFTQRCSGSSAALHGEVRIFDLNGGA